MLNVAFPTVLFFSTAFFVSVNTPLAGENRLYSRDTVKSSGFTGTTITLAFSILLRSMSVSSSTVIFAEGSICQFCS